MVALPKVILASGSPRRKQLLQQADVVFEVIVPNTAELVPPHTPLPQVPAIIALEKAAAVNAQLQNQEVIIVAADTVVLLENQLIGKPTTTQEAIATLQQLQGNTHTVVTGVAILYKGKTHQFSESTEVTMCPLTDAQIEYYVQTYQPFDKAGAYAIQEWIGAVAIEKINGCYYNVMGLPIQKVYQYFQQIILAETT